MHNKKLLTKPLAVNFSETFDSFDDPIDPHLKCGCVGASAGDVIRAGTVHVQGLFRRRTEVCALKTSNRRIIPDSFLRRSKAVAVTIAEMLKELHNKRKQNAALIEI